MPEDVISIKDDIKIQIINLINKEQEKNNEKKEEETR
jgi:hypothetical protein